MESDPLAAQKVQEELEQRPDHWVELLWLPPVRPHLGSLADLAAAGALLMLLLHGASWLAPPLPGGTGPVILLLVAPLMIAGPVAGVILILIPGEWRRLLRRTHPAVLALLAAVLLAGILIIRDSQRRTDPVVRVTQEHGGTFAHYPDGSKEIISPQERDRLHLLWQRERSAMLLMPYTLTLWVLFAKRREMLPPPSHAEPERS